MRKIAASIRYQVAQWTYRALLGPVGGRLPLGGIRSLQESMYREDVRQHVGDIEELSPSEVAYFSFPESFPPWFRREKAFDRRNLYRLSDIYVSPNSGLVWLPHGSVVEESLGSLRRIMGWQKASKDSLLPAGSLKTKDPLVVCPPQGYFHWLYEELPRILYAVNYEPDVRLLLFDDSPSYVLESLRRCLGAEYVSNAMKRKYPVRVSSLILSAADPYSGFIPVQDLELLRKSVLGREDSSPRSDKSKSRILYVSRRGTSRRSMTQEEKLEKELQRRGVEVIRAETFSFDEQVRLFRDVDLVIGPHGAGLSNILWARESEVLEIFPYSEFNDCYARIARTLGFGYHYLHSNNDGTTYGRVPVSQVTEFVDIWKNSGKNYPSSISSST